MQVIIAIVVILVVLAIAFGVWSYTRRRRVDQAQEQYGPEYERTVARYGGDKTKAAEVLQDRQQQVEKITIHPLSQEQRDQYTSQWQTIQAQFVDDPAGAVQQADHVITDAMQKLGYPVDKFNDREAMISVQYPQVAENYRQAHAIAQQQQSGQADTEGLREAMVL